MEAMARFSLKNPMAVILLCIMLIGGGIYAFSTTQADLLPDIEFPELSITLIYPGAAAEDVSQQVTEPVENQLSGLAGLSRISSQSYESVSRIQLSFPIGTDMDQIEAQANELIREANLPDGVQSSVERFSFGAFPVVSLALFPVGDGNIEQWAEEVLKPELQQINGVNTVALAGGPIELLQLIVDKDAAQQAGIQLGAIQDTVRQAFFSFPGGSIPGEEVIVPVRVTLELETLEQLAQLEVRSPFSGESLQLSEFVTWENVSDRAEYTRYNLQEALSLGIIKRQDANTVDVADRVYEVLNRYSDMMEYAIVFDQAEGIKLSIKELVTKGLYGALFASLAVLLFLRNVRATVIAVLSIPLSLLIAAIFIKFWGITLNVMSLAAMAVAVGRVVDDSIIVIENIYRKFRLNPEGDKTQLTIEGTKEMIKPILSSTIASIVVFMPLGLVGGITGAFFMPFALTVVVALIGSLVVSITLIPVLARFSFFKMKESTREPFFVRWYEKVIRFSLPRKALILSLSLLLLLGSGALYAFGNLGFVFLPNEENKQLLVNFSLPASTSLEVTNEVSRQLEAWMVEQEQVKDVFVAIGSRDFVTGLSLSNQGQMFVALEQTANVREAIALLEGELTPRLQATHPTATIAVQELQEGGPPANNNVNINLFSSDRDALQQAANQVEAYMLTRDDLQYVRNNLQDKQQQWMVNLDPVEMNRLGVSPFVVLGTINDQTTPVRIGHYTLNGTAREIQVAYDRKLTGEELGRLFVFTQAGPVELNTIAEISLENVVTSVQKLEGRIFAQISAEVIGTDVFGTSADVTNAIAALDLPDNVSLESGGGSDELQQLLIDVLVAIGVAIGLVYLTLLIFFGKARLPFVILTSLLFVPIGSLLALWLGREPLSMSAMIGFLMLVGIVVTNAIVLLDRIQQNRESGMFIRDALIEAGKTRIRPILMTALATIAALLPLAFSTPEGGLISRGLALVVIGGLTTSTLLTLVFVPVAYEIAFFKKNRQELQSKSLINKDV